MAVRLIAVDMDGTLIGPDGKISAENLAALDAARATGIEVAVCTGRRYSFAMRVLHPHGWPAKEWVVSSNGTVVRASEGTLVRREHLPVPVALRLCQRFPEYRDALVFTFDLEGGPGQEVPGALLLQESNCLHRSIRRWVESNARSIRRVADLQNALRETEAPEPIQAMLCGSIAPMAEAEAVLAGEFADSLDIYRTEYPEHDLRIVDILPKGSSKQSALRWVMARRGIVAGEVMAIGDNWNDVPMLEMAGQAVLMGNAPVALQVIAREQGWTIGEQCENHGVAHAVLAMLERQNEPADLLACPASV